MISPSAFLAPRSPHEDDPPEARSHDDRDHRAEGAKRRRAGRQHRRQNGQGAKKL
jgi:hypothetical protein